MNPSIDFNWIKVPEGSATIGSSLEEIDRAYSYWKEKLLNHDYQKQFRSWLMKEYPKHRVEVKSFCISDILITNRLYEQYLSATMDSEVPESLKTPSEFNIAEHPVWGVTFTQAKRFCHWLGGQLGIRVDLPTEVEWEYAARGETDDEYPWGNEFVVDFCNTFESGINSTTPVRKYKRGRSKFGLYDMGGNVEEWVDTLYQPYEGGKFVNDDLVHALGENYPVLKGGSFARGGDLCRVARRHGGHPNPEFRFTGFRVVYRQL